MAELFPTGRIIDLILLLVALECIALGAWRFRTGGGLAFTAIAPTLVAGVFLLFALRSALIGAPWPVIAYSLACSGIAHAADLYLRLRK